MTIHLNPNRPVADLAVDLDMTHFADMRLGSSAKFKHHFELDIVDEAVAALDQAVYMWGIGSQLVYVGKCKATLSHRHKYGARWLSRFGSKVVDRPERKHAVQAAERVASLWVSWMRDGTVARCYGRQGAMVETPSGWLRAYDSEEVFLIDALDPPLNRRGKRMAELLERL